MEPLSFKELIRASLAKKTSTKISSSKKKSKFPKTLCLTEEFSAVPQTLQWSFHQAHTLISCLEPIRKNTTQRLSNKSGHKPLRSSLHVTLRPQRPPPASKTSISKQTSLWLNSLIRHRCMRLPAKLVLTSQLLKLLGPCHNWEAFQKRLLLKIMRFSSLMMKLNPYSPYFVEKLLNKLAWKF